MEGWSAVIDVAVRHALANRAHVTDRFIQSAGSHAFDGTERILGNRPILDCYVPVIAGRHCLRYACRVAFPTLARIRFSKAATRDVRMSGCVSAKGKCHQHSARLQRLAHGLLPSLEHPVFNGPTRTEAWDVPRRANLSPMSSRVG
ncbi:conserved hypothetical protein [Ricinus communis]|uniref:Uncharacterized protein n=1 Tax=Ricinus communis TaxID=3988 RepID=B9TC16_RICCO|nr:conserved hypothetical protein [Ricinus communis]